MHSATPTSPAVPRPHSTSRRNFLQASALFTAPWIVPASVLGRVGTVPPSERIQVGVIGLGTRGFHLLEQFLGFDDCRVRAVCDVDDEHSRDNPAAKLKNFGRLPAQRRVAERYAAEKSGTPDATVSSTRDFREVCGREDLDAVVVATPDHWHALCTLTALRSGKDVYCEKPVTHLFAEGQLIYREVRQRNAIFQTGSQQRSSSEFRRAVELARNNVLGRITRFEVGLPPGYAAPQGSAEVTAPPARCDYDFWCGPGPLLPYMVARHHRWWRGTTAFGGGVLMDWIGHHNDIGHWAIDADSSGPLRVEAVGWTFPETKVYDTPLSYEIRCTYAGGIESSISSQHPMGLKLIGDAGWVHVTRGKLTASDPRWIAPNFAPGQRTVYESNDHARNFLDGVRSRRECIAPAETAHRSITPGHLGYVSHALGRAIQWNPQSEQAVDDPKANELLSQVAYREPWSLNI